MKIRQDMNEFLASTALPFMFIFGRKDNYISNETADLLIAKYPQAAVLLLENSGHMGFIEESKVSLEAIQKFVG
jgi:pimeloyl-ACP methyl ester carboxylesterase